MNTNMFAALVMVVVIHKTEQKITLGNILCLNNLEPGSYTQLFYLNISVSIKEKLKM